MKTKNLLLLLVVGIAALWVPVAPGHVRAQEPPKVQIPSPGLRRS